MEPRQARVELLYEGKDITKNISPDLLSFSYIDNASGDADDISLRLKDESGKWISTWAPRKGDIIKPKLITSNWYKEGDFASLSCGNFLVDEVSYSGRPRVATIGAISVPANTGFMTTLKSRTWKKASIHKIAQSIASNDGLNLVFDTKTNPTPSFVEQSEEADVSFLFDLCQKNGLAMKLHNRQIVIFSEAEYEAKNAVLTLTESDFTEEKGKPRLITSWNAKTSFTDTGYDGCTVTYTHPHSGKHFSYTFKAPGKKGNKIYHVNESVDSFEEVQRLAKNKLRELNKQEYTLALTMMGNLKLVASQTINIKGLGIFNGKYYIDVVRHSLDNGFTTELDIHKVLEGY